MNCHLKWNTLVKGDSGLDCFLARYFLTSKEKRRSKNVAKKQLRDEYGNNTNFPNNIMSDITTKGLLGKYTSRIFSEVNYPSLK